ncbi:MAG: hypothetical protein GXP27_00325 [Planctomycetes bacterium]|nr:hypothetical protein [Planctomycetota bacterium]
MTPDVRSYGAERVARWTFRFAIAFFVCEALGLAFLTWRHGSVSAALAYLDGHRLYVARSPGVVGPVPPGVRAEVSFLLRNLWSRPVQVVGAAPC